MTEDKLLPYHDKDLKLARTVGNQLESGRPLSELSDPLIDTLLKYRRETFNRSEITGTPSSTESIWNNIAQQSGLNITTETPVTPISGTKTEKVEKSSNWIRAAAASLLIIVTAGLIYYLTSLPGTELIARSQDTIYKVTLVDGSTVTLRPNSALYSIESEKNNMIFELKGEGFFEVTENKNRTFAVQSESGRVSVLGTKFNVSTWGKLMQVYLEEGSIKVEKIDSRESVILKPGEYAAIDSNNQLVKSVNVEKELYIDWLNNELSFKNQSPELVFKEIEQHYGISISIAGDISQRGGITGSLVLDSLNQSLSDLELVIGGQFQETGSDRYRFIPEK